MDRIETQASGGCQCGAVRYHVTAVLDTSHICHCRMCQKAAGNFFIALIGVPRDAIDGTRGTPAWFNSSDKAARGFCRDCGTRSEEHTSELQSLMRYSYAGFCLKQNKIYIKCTR